MSFRIDGLRPVAEINKTDRTNSVKKAGMVSGKMDAVAISSEAKDYQIAIRALKDAPDLRESKISDVLGKIESGGFDLSSADIAGKLLSLFDRLD